MAKKMLFLLVPLLVSAAVLPAYGQMAENGPLNEEAVLAIIASSPSESERPDLDALVLFEGVFIDYESGLASIRTQRLTRLYTELAIDELGDPRLAYDRSRQEFVLHRSRTYLPDGTTIDTPDREKDGYTGVNEVTPDLLDLAVDHIDIREVVVTRVGLVREAVLLLDYTIRETKPGDLPFNHLHFFQGEFPALRKVLEVDGDLFQETMNPADRIYEAPPPADIDGKMVWRLKDVPPAPHNRHRLGDQIPWVAISSSSWDEILTLFREKIFEAAAERGAIPPILEKLEESEPFLGPRTELETWMKMIEDRTELIDYNPWVYTPVPRGVDTALFRSYATPAERCAILSACFLQRHRDFRLILPARWATLTESVPVLEALGHPFLRDCGNGARDDCFVDPVSGEITPTSPLRSETPAFTLDIQDRNSKANRLEPGRGQAEVDISFYWNLDSDSGRGEGILGGSIAGVLERGNSVEVIQDWIERWREGSEASARVLSEHPDRIHFAFEWNAPLPEPDDRGRIALQLPISPIDISDLLPAGLNREQSSINGVLFHNVPVNVHFNWKVDIPENAILLPGAGKESAWKDASFKVERTESGERVEIDYTLKLAGASIAAADYAEYRAFVADLLDEKLTRIVLVPDEEE